MLDGSASLDEDDITELDWRYVHMALLDPVHRRTGGTAGFVAVVIIENRLNQLMRGLPHVLDRCQHPTDYPGTILPVRFSEK